MDNWRSKFHGLKNNNAIDELTINNNSKNLIISFAGNAPKGRVSQFEMLYLLTNNFSSHDLFFYVDRRNLCYHKGIYGISHDILSTVEYLKQKISKYDNVIVIGGSAGGYAAILFGSLVNATNVIAFYPPTKVSDDGTSIHCNLNTAINTTTIYNIYGDLSVSDSKDPHHISHCENVNIYPNVFLTKRNTVNLKEMRNSGVEIGLIGVVFWVMGRVHFVCDPGVRVRYKNGRNLVSSWPGLAWPWLSSLVKVGGGNVNWCGIIVVILFPHWSG